MNPAPLRSSKQRCQVGQWPVRILIEVEMINRANDGVKTSPNTERTAQLGASAGLFLLPNVVSPRL